MNEFLKEPPKYYCNRCNKEIINIFYCINCEKSTDGVTMKFVPLASIKFIDVMGLILKGWK